MATGLKELVVTLAANAKPVLEALRRVDHSLIKTSHKLKATSESFYRFGREIGLIVSLPIAALGVASLKATMDIQSLEASLTSILARYNTGVPIQQAVTNEMGFLRQATDELGVSFESALKPYMGYLAASKDNLQTNRHVMKSFLGLASALGKSGSDVDRMIRALEQMQSKGMVMSEELKLQLGDTLPGAVGLFAEAMGVSTQELMKLMQAGKVSSSILSKVADVIDKKYGAAINKGANSMRAGLNRVSNAFFMLRTSVGRGLDETFNLTDNLNKFADWLKKVAEGFNRLDDSGKKTLLTIGVILAGIGPLLLAFGALSGLLSMMITGFRLLISPLMLVVEGFKLLRIMVVTNPLALFLTTTTLIIYYWKDIVNLFKEAFNWIDKISGKAWKGIKHFFGFGDADKQSKQVSESSDIGVGAKKALSADIGVGAKKALSSVNNNSNAVNNNQKTVHNNLTVNIPTGMSANDAENIKVAVKQAMQEQTRQNYMELATQ